MAPSDTPWNDWAATFPGSVDKGPIPSQLVMYLPLLLFLVQAAYAARSFLAKRQEISQFYATLIVLNIIAMALVSGPTSLNGLLPGYVNEAKRFELSTSNSALWYMNVLLFSAIHSVNNCCRVAFDAYGLRAAKRLIPVAVALQGWQLVALPFGFSPFTGIVALTVIDYLQHFGALTYWLVKIGTAKRGSSMTEGDTHNTNKTNTDVRRLWYGVGGVLLHMVSVVPQLYYIVTVEAQDQTTAGLCLVYSVTTVGMFSSQCFWIAMAGRTPPRRHDHPEKTEQSADESDLDEEQPFSV